MHPEAKDNATIEAIAQLTAMNEVSVCIIIEGLMHGLCPFKSLHPIMFQRRINANRAL